MYNIYSQYSNTVVLVLQFSTCCADSTEIPRYHELGLGRGINVTDPDMWKNKTPYLVREACEKNTISTQEIEIFERYTKEVSTFDMQQQHLLLSLYKPRLCQVKIEMDEQTSRSSTSVKLIEGHKIETRTISFQLQFDDLPFYYDSGFNKFEEYLAEWLLKHIIEREIKSDVDDLTVKKKSMIQKLADKLRELVISDDNGQGLKYILCDCKAFLEHQRTTHYISAIKLGACEYHNITSRFEQKLCDVCLSSSMAVSSLKGLSWLSDKKKDKKIGRIDLAKKEVVTEGVIGFEIQPISKLVRIPFIEMALRKAIKDYIQSKDNSKLFLFAAKFGIKLILPS